MSGQSKQTIGDQLRAFAQRRRDADAAPFQPHPMTRKLLQDEVARTFSARTIARQTTPGGLLAAFWLRLGFAGGVLAVFIVAAFLWWPEDSAPRTELAQKSDKAMPAQRQTEAPPPGPAAGGGLGGGGDSVRSDQLALQQKQDDAEVGRRYGLNPPKASEPDSFVPKPDANIPQISRTPEQLSA